MKKAAAKKGKPQVVDVPPPDEPTEEELEAQKLAALAAQAEEQSRLAIEEKSRLNKARVVFRTPTVKGIVSPHSGSILSDPEPKPTLDDKLREIALASFEEVAVNGVVNVSGIAELFARCDFLTELSTLQETIVKHFDLPEEITQVLFIDILEKFHAPQYYYGQRLRRYAGRGQYDDVKTLLIRNCDPNAGDGEGLTPLHYCAEFNQIDIIQLLADIAKENLIINAKDRYGWTPLYCAAHQGNKNCVTLLIELGADVNIVNNVGKSPLHAAAAQCRTTVISILHDAGANLNLPDNTGMTPLHEAAYRGHTTLYHEMAHFPEANIDIVDQLGNTPANYVEVESLPKANSSARGKTDRDQDKRAEFKD